MKSNWLPGINHFYLTAILMLLCVFQTTLWPFLFSSIESPPLWLILMIYVAFYRKLISSYFIIYFFCLIILSFTLMPIKMLVLSLFIQTSMIHFVKRRVYWSGHVYFVLMASIFVTIYHFIYFLLSKSLEPNLISWNLLDRFLQIGMTPFFALLIYRLLTFIDNKTELTDQIESGGIEV